MNTTQMDKQGRLYLPKSIREQMDLSEGTVFRVLQEESDRIVLEKQSSLIRDSRGVYRTDPPIDPDDESSTTKIQDELEEEL